MVRPILLEHDDRCNMRILGNCLSPVHAVLALEHALALVPQAGLPDPARAVQTCLDHRLRASNHLLLPCRRGWILAQPEHLAELLWDWADPLPWGQLPMTHAMPFRQFWLHDDVRMCRLALPPGISLAQAFQVLGIEVPADLLPTYEDHATAFQWHGAVPRNADAILEVAALPTLHLQGITTTLAAQSQGVRPHPLLHSVQADSAYVTDLQKPCLILTEAACFLLDRTGPAFLWSQSCIQELALSSDATRVDVLWSALNGRRLPDPKLPPPVCVLQVGPADDLLLHAGSTGCDADNIHVLSLEAPFLLRLASPTAYTLGHSLPSPHYQALGWQPVLLSSHPVEDKQLLFRPTPFGLQLPCHLLRELFAETLVAGALSRWPRPSSAADDLVAVKVQVYGRCLWQGMLPPQTLFGDVLALWRRIRAACAVQTQARIYSGPRPVCPTLSLAAARSPSAHAFTSRRGLLCVTIMPEICGGGAKDDKWATAQNAMAQQFLEQGLRLPDATSLVDKLFQQAGLGRISRVLQITHPDQKWEETCKLCQQFSLTIPAVEPLSQRVSKKVQAEAARRQLGKTAPALAEHFILQEGFFRNADGTAARVLTTLLPGSSGVILMNSAQAAMSIEAFAGSSCDELAIAVIGHTCPRPDSCSGEQTFAARNLASESVLLCGCLHQLGARAITPSCDHAAEVQLLDCVCVAISVFRLHWSDESAWDSLIRNPVRAVHEHLQGCGSARVLEAPWGRQFRKAGSTVPAKGCDSVHFKARVMQAELEPLLKKSGHNRIFVTPQSWKSEPHPDYAIIWLQGDLDAVCQQALRYQAQLGVACVKGRYGVRISKSTFATAFAALRPGDVAPTRLDIRHTYKLSSVPPGLRSQELVDWATKLKWPIRPLRQLGPHHWMVGSELPAPAGLLMLNKQPILVQEMPPRQPGRPVLSAGRAVPSALSPATAGADPWEAQKDPWSQYLAAKPARSLPVGHTAPAVPAPSRALDAPVGKRFDEQETRLSKLEQGLALVQDAQTQASLEAKAAKQALQGQIDSVRQEAKDFHSSFEQTLQENIASLKSAQSAQQAQVQEGMAELKTLLLRQRSPAQKRPASSVPDMELDG